jgi:hypothetical protein
MVVRTVLAYSMFLSVLSRLVVWSQRVSLNACELWCDSIDLSVLTSVSISAMVMLSCWFNC